MIQAIYSSKIFQASKRQKEIQQKIEAAENIELVQQLIEDLDEEYQTVNTVAPELKDKMDEDADRKDDIDDVDDDTDMSDDAAPKSTPKVGQPVKFSEVEDTPEENKDEETDENEKKPVAESTHVHVVPLDEIKGTLNHSSDTAGVVRIETKESELWVYYDDSVNLNNIMTDVIEMLNAVGYTYLTFNRLARSNNAIVFEMSYNTNLVGDVIE